LVLYGLEATGKSSVIKAVLEALTALPASTAPNGHSEDSTAEDILQFTIVKCAECITGRHLLEQTVGAVAKAVGWTGTMGRCENLAQCVIELGRLLNDQVPNSTSSVKRRFVLVFDGIDNQREPQPTLLPALARLGELVCESDSCKAVMILTVV
jgi:origin recognition complex subunit 5